MRRNIQLIVLSVAIGFSVGYLVARPRSSHAEPAAHPPTEIAVSVPDGAGGRTEIQFTVAGPAYRDSDVQPEIAADESVVTLFHFRPGPERHETVTYRGKPAPRPVRK
jgi:hypothetical protein